MKINKEEWRKMSSLADLHQQDFRGSRTDIKPLPDVGIGEEIYYPEVNHPKHYNAGKYEAIDIIEDWNLDFHCGNAIKYICRHRHKEDPKQDIEKAIWYLQRYLERMQNG